MSFRHSKLKVEKAAHYMAYGNPGLNTTHIWLACHGYAQNFQAFGEAFQLLDPDEHFVLIPSGMSHFYGKGFRGNVVSSWMTSFEREDEIEAYVSFFNQMFYELFDTHTFDHKVKMMGFGFSQGTATISRYAAIGRFSFDQLVLCGGRLAKEIIDGDLLFKQATPKIHSFYGDKDPFLNEEKLNEQELKLKVNEIPFKNVFINAKHDWGVPYLRQVLEKLLI